MVVVEGGDGHALQVADQYLAPAVDVDDVVGDAGINGVGQHVGGSDAGGVVVAFLTCASAVLDYDVAGLSGGLGGIGRAIHLDGADVAGIVAGFVPAGVWGLLGTLTCLAEFADACRGLAVADGALLVCVTGSGGAVGCRAGKDGICGHILVVPERACLGVGVVLVVVLRVDFAHQWRRNDAFDAPDAVAVAAEVVVGRLGQRDAELGRGVVTVSVVVVVFEVDFVHLDNGKDGQGDARGAVGVVAVVDNHNGRAVHVGVVGADADADAAFVAGLQGVFVDDAAVSAIALHNPDALVGEVGLGHDGVLVGKLDDALLDRGACAEGDEGGQGSGRLEVSVLVALDFVERVRGEAGVVRHGRHDGLGDVRADFA